jgi:mannose-1-phosphate guanylyltransferase
MEGTTMKAFLLAAGEGTRLRPITDTIPKCLVPIRRQPLLGIWLELCRESGIDEVLINLHAHSDAVRQFLSANNCDVRVKLFEEPVLLGSAGTIGANRAWVESDPQFFVFYADVLTNMDLTAMLDFHRRSGMAATLGLYEVPNPSQCGIVELDSNNTIRAFHEKPAHPAGNLAFSGVMIGTPEFLQALPADAPADLGFHLFPKLIGRMAGYISREYLVDVGTMGNYEAAQRSWPGVRTVSRLENSHA